MNAMKRGLIVMVCVSAAAIVARAQSVSLLRGPDGPKGPTGPATALQSSALISLSDTSAELVSTGCPAGNPLKSNGFGWTCSEPLGVNDSRLVTVSADHPAVSVSTSGGVATISANLVGTIDNFVASDAACAGNHQHIGQTWIGTTDVQEGMVFSNSGGTAVYAEGNSGGYGNYDRAAAVGVSRASNNGTGIVGDTYATKYGVGVAGIAMGNLGTGIIGFADGSNASGAVGEIAAVTTVPAVYAENSAGGTAFRINSGRAEFQTNAAAKLPIVMMTGTQGVRCPVNYIAIGGGCSSDAWRACLWRSDADACIGDGLYPNPNSATTATGYYCDVGETRVTCLRTL